MLYLCVIYLLYYVLCNIAFNTLENTPGRMNSLECIPLLMYLGHFYLFWFCQLRLQWIKAICVNQSLQAVLTAALDCGPSSFGFSLERHSGVKRYFEHRLNGSGDVCNVFHSLAIISFHIRCSFTLKQLYLANIDGVCLVPLVDDWRLVPLMDDWRASLKWCLAFFKTWTKELHVSESDISNAVKDLRSNRLLSCDLFNEVFFPNLK